MSLYWFESYLTNRVQYVQFNDGISSFSSISTGVPQGSILGPLLFIIYMNDIASVTNKFHFTLYADDTSLVEPICTFSYGTVGTSGISDSINSELCLITDWLCLNKLSLNAKKTKMMIFHHRQKNISKLNLQLFINNTKIEQVKEFDFLGMVIDECMTYNSHINKISSKISRINGVLSRLKRFVPSHILKMIYNALIQPHLNYGILLWGNNIARIQKLQKWSVRSITLSKYNAHTDPLFIKLKILKVSDIYLLSLLKFYHKYKANLLPIYFTGMFDLIYPTHNYLTRQRGQPVVIGCKTKLAEASIRYSLPSTISKMSENITNKISTHSLYGLSNYAKSFFISNYKPVCTI